MQSLEAAESVEEANQALAPLRKHDPGALLDEPALRLYVRKLIDSFRLSADKAVQNWCVVMTAQLFPCHDPVLDALGQMGVERKTIDEQTNAEFRRVLASLQRMRLGDEELDRLLGHWGEKRSDEP